ncbi:MAG: NAD-dependent epimerase/dehydratase family protein [Chloroflexi bacterium]|nr:NAD-dependent epimerase/dehydratase family protein [Chloroflexota bacterium]MBV9596896.1 NAD-dependent epimerase/dehydratase family protein [Chloroflexota bacterium]
MSGRSVLIVGGTGFLGRRMADAFVQAGDHVSVLSRGQRALEGVSAPVEHLFADRHDAVGLREALGERTFDVVVDNVAFDAADVASLLALLDMRVGHYLLTSSTAVYADRFTRRPIREADADLSVRTDADAPNPFHPRLGHAYANGKRAAEQVVRQSRVAWTILRAPVIVGAHDRTGRVWWFVQRLLDGGPIVIPDWGAGRIFQVAWVDDVARAFVAAARQPPPIRRTYNVAQAEIFSSETWVAACARALGVAARYVHVPESSLGERGLDGYTLPIAGRPFGHMLLDIGAIRCELGFEPSAEKVWLNATIQGCAANPPTVSSGGYDRRADETRLAAVGSTSC